MTQKHMWEALPALSADLAASLERIDKGIFMPVTGGYMQPGANITISLATVEKLEGLGLVRQHADFGRKTVQLTTRGLRTLDARDKKNSRYAKR